MTGRYYCEMCDRWFPKAGDCPACGDTLRTIRLVDRLQDYFRKRPNVWIDGRDLFHVAGSYAWRSRIADVRQEFGMQIENRIRFVDGVKVSEYRYVPAAETPADDQHDANAWSLRP